MEKAEFAKDFGEFYAEIRKGGIEVELTEIATLYAIYRKDLRAGKFNNGNRTEPGKEKATERQKEFLIDLAYKNGVCITQKELDGMTREQARETNNTLTRGSLTVMCEIPLIPCAYKVV
jgi:hypothetical protein